jgi:Holliday junction resolvasome RuvABC endonuclease subunit
MIEISAAAVEAIIPKTNVRTNIRLNMPFSLDPQQRTERWTIPYRAYAAESIKKESVGRAEADQHSHVPVQ